MARLTTVVNIGDPQSIVVMRYRNAVSLLVEGELGETEVRLKEDAVRQLKELFEEWLEECDA